MGECYWHGYEVYPGHPCPECERIGRTREWMDGYEKRLDESIRKEQKEWTKFISNLAEKED
jgi:hypothetical protein